MKVGLVCPYDLSKPGGVQAQVYGLRAALELAGDDAVVIGPGLPGDVPGWDLGGTVAVPGNGSVAPISLDPRVGATIRSVSRDLDVLHVHEPFMPTVGFAALRAGPSVVATFHAAATGIGRRFYNLIGGQAGRLLGKNVKRITAVSRSAASALPEGLDPVIVPNGVDVAAFAPTGDERRLRVAFLGRDEPRKGLDVLLAAWPRVKESVPDAELVVMGADRGIDGIEWLGTVDDETKARVLGSSAIYAAPNTGRESFGVILIEGMAAGAAVVASDLDAFVDVGEGAARYFKTGAPESLASVLTSLLTDAEARSELSDRGMRRAQEFDWSSVAGLYRDLYDEAAS